MDRLPGFRDFYPNPSRTRMSGARTRASIFFDRWRTQCRRHGFREYDGPPLETLELYTTKSGDEIVGSSTTSTDKGQRDIALRRR